MTAVKSASKKKSAKPSAAGKLALDAATAAGLMTADPVSIRRSATTDEAATLLTQKRISAAPVIDEAGRPVGVVSRADLVRYEGEKAEFGLSFYEPTSENGDAAGAAAPAKGSTLPVSAVMTPKVFAVGRDAPAAQVVKTMLDRRVHRLFVVDAAGVLVGVVSSLDLVRHLSAGSGGRRGK